MSSSSKVKKKLSFSVYFGSFFILLIIFSGLFAPFICSLSPNTQILELRNQPPLTKAIIIYYKHRKNLPVQAKAVISFTKTNDGLFYIDFSGRKIFG